MSLEAMSWALQQKTGATSLKLVLLLLANRHNADTGQCNPSIAKIASETEISPRQVKRILKDLADGGFLTIEEKTRDNGSQSANQYTLHMSPGGVMGVPPPVSPTSPLGVSPASPLEPEVRTGTGTGSEPSVAVAPVLPYDPVKGKRINGQDLVWNALADVTKAYGAANGARMKNALTTIRAVSWAFLEEKIPEITRWVQEDPDGYEERLAGTVHSVFKFLDQESPGLTWGPEGIARNWARALLGIHNRDSTISKIVEDTQRRMAL